MPQSQATLIWPERTLGSVWASKCRPVRYDEYAEIKVKETIESAFSETLFVPATDRPAQVETTAQKFRRLADTWQRETAHQSSMMKRVMNENYQAIMAMGPSVVPLLLADLAHTRRDWFWALHHLAEHDPTETLNSTNRDDMIAAWETWGKERGII